MGAEKYAMTKSWQTATHLACHWQMQTPLPEDINANFGCKKMIVE